MISAVFLGVVLCGLGYATHVRNSVWITEKSLWTDAHRKAPQLSRPLHNLAWGHYDRSGRLREAMLLYMRALEKKTHRKYERAITYDNIAAIYYELGYYPDAVVYWQKALSVLPEHNEYRYRTALALFGQRRWESALIQVEQILDDSPGNVDYLLLKGRILLQQGRNWAALKHFQTCLGRMPRSPTVAICCGMALEALGANINAAVLYRYAISLQSDNLEARMRLAGVQVQRGIKYEALIRNMTLNHPLSEIQKVLHLLDFSAVPDERTYVQLVDVIDLQFQALFHDLP